MLHYFSQVTFANQDNLQYGLQQVHTCSFAHSFTSFHVFRRCILLQCLNETCIEGHKYIHVHVNSDF